MNTKYAVIVLLVVALAAASGCTGTQTATPSGTGTPAGTSSQQGGGSLVPGPTQVMPDNLAVSVTVGEKEYTGNIPVTFDGGKGQINVQRIDVKLTRFDGSVSTTTLGKNKGDEVILEGTRGEGSNKGQPDRIEVTVVMNSGQSFKIVDTTREYRTRG